MPTREEVHRARKGAELTKDLTRPSQFVPSHGRGKLNCGGTPGHKGGSGRPKDELKAFWGAVLNGTASRREVRRILQNADHPAFVSLYSKLAIHVVGVPGKDENVEADDS